MWGGFAAFAGKTGAMGFSRGNFWSSLAKQYASGGGGGGGAAMGAGGPQIGKMISGMISNVQRPNFSGSPTYGGGPGSPQTAHTQDPNAGVEYAPPSAVALRPRRNPAGDYWGPVVDQLIRSRAMKARMLSAGARDLPADYEGTPDEEGFTWDPSSFQDFAARSRSRGY